MSLKRPLAQEIRLGSPDRFSSWEGGVWGRDYTFSGCLVIGTPSSSLAFCDTCKSGRDWPSQCHKKSEPGNDVTYKTQYRLVNKQKLWSTTNWLTDYPTSFMKWYMYLCVVLGCDSMPANLQKFGTPWTPLKKSLVTNGQICRVRSLPGNNGKVCTYRFCSAEMLSNQTALYV